MYNLQYVSFKGPVDCRIVVRPLRDLMMQRPILATEDLEECPKTKQNCQNCTSVDLLIDIFVHS